MAMMQGSPGASASPDTARQTAQSPALVTGYATAVANAPNGVRAEVSLEEAARYLQRLSAASSGLQKLPDSKPLEVDPDDL